MTLAIDGTCEACGERDYQELGDYRVCQSCGAGAVVDNAAEPPRWLADVAAALDRVQAQLERIEASIKEL